MKIVQTERIRELCRIMGLNAPKRTDAHIICETGDATSKAMADAIKDKREQLVCGRVDKPLVAVGSSMAEYNKEYCRENNISVLYSPNPVGGGAVVFSAGDLTFSFITADLQSGWLAGVQAGICEYLAKKGLNAVIDKNDILIDGKKVSGSSGGVHGGVRTDSLFFAVVSSAEHISRICLKKSGKQPASLQEYGITAQEIQDAVISLTKRYTGKTARAARASPKPHGRRTLRDILGSGRQNELERVRGRFRGQKDKGESE